MVLTEEFQFQHPPVQEGNTLHLIVRLVKKTSVGFKDKKQNTGVKKSGYLIEVDSLNPKLGQFELRCRTCYAERMEEGKIYDLPVRKPKDWLFSAEGPVMKNNNPFISNRFFQGVVNGYPIYQHSIRRVFVASESNPAQDAFS